MKEPKYIDELVYGENLVEAKKLLRECLKPESAKEPYITNILTRLIWLHKTPPQWRDEKGRFKK